jgi:hypothetical protein
VKKTVKRYASRFAIYCIGGLPELHAVEHALNVTRYSISRHDKCCIERVNVLARHRALRMANKCRDRDFRESEIIGNACKAMSENVWRDVRESLTFEYFLPLIGKAAEGVVVTLSRKYMGARI